MCNLVYVINFKKSKNLLLFGIGVGMTLTVEAIVLATDVTVFVYVIATQVSICGGKIV